MSEEKDMMSFSHLEHHTNNRPLRWFMNRVYGPILHVISKPYYRYASMWTVDLDAYEEYTTSQNLIEEFGTDWGSSKE